MLLREQESFVGVSDSNDVRIKKLDTYATATVKTTVGGWSGLANVPNNCCKCLLHSGCRTIRNLRFALHAFPAIANLRFGNGRHSTFEKNATSYKIAAEFD